MEKQPKKILFIITKSTSGGAQRYVFDLATNLPKEQFETVVAFGGNGPLKTKLESSGIKTFQISGLERDLGLLKDIKAFFSILKIIRTVHPDIVHLNSSKAGILGALASRLYNVYIFLHNPPKPYALHPSRTIFTAHGWAFKEKRSFIAKKIIEYVSWLNIYLSHRTIVVSEDDQKKVQHFLFVQNKITLIYNGIKQISFMSRNEARFGLSSKCSHSFSDDTFLIGSIAELHKNKGLEYAVASIKAVKNNSQTPANTCYVVIGGGEEQKNIEEAIGRDKLNENIFLAGEIPDAAKLLKAFDIFLLPSLKEGLPYVLLEAGLAGLSTIATNVGGAPEIIEDMKSGIIIHPKRPREISESLTFLINHPEKRKEFGETLAKTVAEKFTL
ncbi:MAG: glycosyltransferase family 1 protein, partial [Candidatus Taylorbacteria bacterium]|nr:glycosyltransferase family 1 protein [Candidatus Taylorbacteria bacterium]